MSDDKTTQPTVDDKKTGGDEDDDEEESKGPVLAKEEECKATFTPLVNLETLPEVEVKTMEENEDTLCKMRAKLFRFDKSEKQWKERGTGEVKLLQHKESKKIRVLMRRDKTLKLCANHLIIPGMKLTENVGSDRSWVWTTACDLSEETPTEETFAIRFGTPEIAKEFKVKFEEAIKIVEEQK